MIPTFFVLIVPLALSVDLSHAQSLPLSISPLPSGVTTSVPVFTPTTFRGPGPVQPSGTSSTGNDTSSTSSSDVVTSTANSSATTMITNLPSLTTPLPSATNTGTSPAGSGASDMHTPAMFVWVAVAGGITAMLLD